MKEKKISIVVTAYNVGAYINKCLDSILAQSYNNLEIIVVNDGSQDDTGQILEEYASKDKRIRVITQENRGGGPARNVGVDNATGEYILILDGDDFFEPDMIDCMQKQLESTNSDVVICDAYFYNNETHDTGKLPTALRESYLPEQECFSWKDIPEHIFNISTGFVWNKMYRLDFVRNYNLRFQDVRRIDDLFFEMKSMICAKRITFLKQSLVYYRCNNPTSQQGRAIETADTLYLAYIEVKKWLMEEGIYEKVKRSFVNREIASFRDDLTLMNTPSMYEKMYNLYRNKYFKALDLIKKENYYYDEDDEKWLFEILDYTPAENAFKQLLNLKDKFKYQGATHPFPYEKIKQGAKISIYGAGSVGRDYFIQLFKNPKYHIISWVDRRNQEIGFPILSPKSLVDSKQDVIIIAVENMEVIKEIKKDLLNMGFDENCIIY